MGAQLSRRPIAAALLALVAFAGGASLAHADAGELTVGGGLNATVPAAVGPSVAVRVGLSDDLAIEGIAHGRLGDGDPQIDLGLALVGAIDFVTWVPEIAVGGGARVINGAAAYAEAGLGVRRFLSIDSALGARLTAGRTFTSAGAWFGRASVVYYLDL